MGNYSFVVSCVISKRHVYLVYCYLLLPTYNDVNPMFIIFVFVGAIFGGPETMTVYTAFRYQLEKQNNRSIFQLHKKDAMVDMLDNVETARSR